MDWQGMIQFLGGSAIFAAALGFIGKAAVDAYLKGRIEEHKADLQRVATEHSVRFQRLHTERADIIKDLYAHLATLDDLLSSALRSFQAVGEATLEDKIQELSKSYNALREYYVPKRIFFAEDTCTSVDQILEHAKGMFFDITVYPVDPQSVQYKYNRDILKDRHAFWEKARAAHNNEFATAKKQLEKQFRQALGIGV